MDRCYSLLYTLTTLNTLNTYNTSLDIFNKYYNFYMNMSKMVTEINKIIDLTKNKEYFYLKKTMDIIKKRYKKTSTIPNEKFKKDKNLIFKIDIKENSIPIDEYMAILFYLHVNQDSKYLFLTNTPILDEILFDMKNIKIKQKFIKKNIINEMSLYDIF